METETKRSILASLLKIKIRTIISIFIIFCFLFLLLNHIVYSMASSLCTKTELKPVRYEYGGLFGNQKIVVPTTEGNQDAYERVCISTGQPSYFSISENIEFLIKQSQKNMNNEK